MFPPQIPYYSTMYQLSPHFKINILYLVPTSCQCTSFLWGECGDMLMWGKPRGNVDTHLFLISPSIPLIHCGENVGTMLMWGKPGENVDTDLFLILLPYHSSIVGRMWRLCWCGENLGKMEVEVNSWQTIWVHQSSEPNKHRSIAYTDRPSANSKAAAGGITAELSEESQQW